MPGERLQNIGEQLLRGAALGGPRYANGVGLAVHRRIQSGGHGGDAGSGGTGRGLPAGRCVLLAARFHGCSPPDLRFSIVCFLQHFYKG